VRLILLCLLLSGCAHNTVFYREGKEVYKAKGDNLYQILNDYPQDKHLTFDRVERV